MMYCTDISLIDQQKNFLDLETIRMRNQSLLLFIWFMYQMPNVQNAFVEVLNEVNQYKLGKSYMVYC